VSTSTALVLAGALLLVVGLVTLALVLTRGGRARLSLGRLTFELGGPGPFVAGAEPSAGADSLGADDLSDLIAAVAAGECVLFAGAGVPASVGAPTWSELLRTMSRR
jgi:hypothetical protein